MSPLKWQTRVISCFPNSTGFAMGSVEGRVAIQYVLPISFITYFASPLTDTTCLPRYVEEKDAQSVPSHSAPRQAMCRLTSHV